MVRHGSIGGEILEQLWPPDCREDEIAFYNQTGAVATALFEARQAQDFDNAHLLLDALAFARGVWPSEPNLSMLDHAYAQAAYYFVDWLICKHEYQRALKYAAAGWQALAEKNARRENLGLRPSRSSGVRMSLLGAISDAKWRTGDPARDLILPAQEHGGLYLELSSAFKAGAATGEMPATDIELHAFDAIWAGLWVSVVCRYYCPDPLEAVMNECNGWHMQLFGRPALTLNFDEPLATTIWQWHFQIASLWLAHCSGQPVSVASMKELFRGLETAAGRSPESVADRPYMESIRKDCEWLCRQLRQDSLALAS